MLKAFEYIYSKVQCLKSLNLGETYKAIVDMIVVQGPFLAWHSNICLLRWSYARIFYFNQIQGYFAYLKFKIFLSIIVSRA